MKRPLLWMMVAFVLGIVCYEGKMVNVLLGTLLWYALLSVFFASKLWEFKKEKYLALILSLFPILFLTGYLRMNQQIGESEIETVVLKKMEATIVGTVDEIQCYEDSNAIVLKDVHIKLQESEDIYNCKKTIVYVSIEDSIQYGNLLSIKGTIYPLTRASNQGQYNQYVSYKSKDISIMGYAKEVTVLNAKTNQLKHSLFTFKEQLKSAYEKLLPKKEAGVLIAMLLGDKSLLNKDVNELYQENGISHILAISGLHMSFFGLTIYKLLRKKCSTKTSTVIAFLLIILYGVLTNNSVSAMRAICMLMLLLLSTILGKTYDILSALSLSAILLLLQKPMQLYQAGFLLSYGAMVGIAVIYKIFQSLKVKCDKPIIKGILEGFLISLSVQIISLPIITYFYFEITPYSVLLNLLVIPLLSILFPMAVVAGVISFVSLPLASICMGVAYYILVIYEKLCLAVERLPYHLYLLGQPSKVQLLLYFFCVIACSLICIKVRKKQALLLYLLCPFLLIVPQNAFQITLLDVGQGECIVVKNDNGNVYMIDGGSTDIKTVGDKRIIPYLKSQGISRLQGVFITHADADHMNGVKEILLKMEEGATKRKDYSGDISIDVLCLPELEEYSEVYQELILLAKNKGVEVRFFSEGEFMTDANLQLTCLSPDPKVAVTDTNSHSLVMHLNYGEFDALFTGDIDAIVERRVMEVLKTYNQQSFELLKVSHHGSKYSSDETFLSYLSPEHAVISCGKNNSYGHPHIETIDALEKVSATIHKTSTNGAVTINSDGEDMAVLHYNK